MHSSRFPECPLQRIVQREGRARTAIKLISAECEVSLSCPVFSPVLRVSPDSTEQRTLTTITVRTDVNGIEKERWKERVSE